MRAGPRTGRGETGLPVRSDALEPGFHGVLRARRGRDRDAEGAGV